MNKAEFQAAKKAAANLKVNILALLMKVAYEPPRERLQARLDNLILQNCQILAVSGFWVSFKGRVWTHSLGMGAKLPLLIPRPAKSLQEPLNKWLAEYEQLEEEERLSGGGLTAVLNAVSDFQDYYRTLPTCLHPALQEYLAWIEPPAVCTPLTDDQVAQLQAKQVPYIGLLQQRMLHNLVTA